MPTILRDQYVVINGVTLCIKAFQAVDLAPLLDGPKYRGDLVAQPGVPGKVSFDDVIDATDFVLAVNVDGAWDPTDAANPDPDAGLEANFDYLKANLGIGLASVTLAWHRAAGDVKSGPVKIRGPYGAKKLTSSYVERTTFDIVLLNGVLT